MTNHVEGSSKTEGTCTVRQGGCGSCVHTRHQTGLETSSTFIHGSASGEPETVQANLAKKKAKKPKQGQAKKVPAEAATPERY